jgi:hypothetical protein
MEGGREGRERCCRREGRGQEGEWREDGTWEAEVEKRRRPGREKGGEDKIKINFF